MADQTYDATEMLRQVEARRGTQLSLFVAETGLWASPEVHQWLVAKDGYGAWFPMTRRCRKGEKRREIYRGERTDDNTYANKALKRALGFNATALTDFEVCHIWPETCYDVRYHTTIANLVLLPRALASLSDHYPEVQRALRFRSFEVYDGWYPADYSLPSKSETYPPPSSWLKPVAFTPRVARSLETRNLTYLAALSNEGTSGPREPS